MQSPPTSNNPKDPEGAFVARGRIVERVDGPLSGLSFVVKDNIQVSGMPFTAGHPLFTHRFATTTAPAVARLLAGGAELRGMTQTDAGGFGVTTPQTRNPVTPAYVVGGSSGGTAAAIAAGCTDFGLGTDTAGSVRIPAACTGLFAIKPSFAAISTDGIDPLAPSFDHIGILARDYDVLVQATNFLLPAQDQHAPSVPETFRIGIDTEVPDFWTQATQAAFLAVCKDLQSSGHRVIRLPLPKRRELAKTHAAMLLQEARAVYSWCSEQETQALGEAAKRALRYARTRASSDDDAAALSVAAAQETLETAFSRVDAVLIPTLAGLPPRASRYKMELGTGIVSAVEGMVMETCLANVLGTPAMTLPTSEHLGPLPFSVQLIGPRGSDRRLMRCAGTIARQTRSRKGEFE